jgi:hypothetical protein
MKHGKKFISKKNWWTLAANSGAILWIDCGVGSTGKVGRSSTDHGGGKRRAASWRQGDSVSITVSNDTIGVGVLAKLIAEGSQSKLP